MNALLRLPERAALTNDGERVMLRALTEEGPAALVFLRHLGCLFCRDQVLELRDAEVESIWFVALATSEEATAFRQEMGVRQRFLCDPDADLFQEFDLGSANLTQMVHPSVVWRGMRATLRGARQTASSPRASQLGGAFVAAQGGDITWAHRSANVADNVSAATLTQQLQAARELPRR